METGRFTDDAELSTAAVGACDDATDAAGNSGRTRDFILRGPLQLRRVAKVFLIGRGPLQARMRPLRVVPVDVVGNVCARRADAVVGPQVHPLVFHAAPTRARRRRCLARPRLTNPELQAEW